MDTKFVKLSNFRDLGGLKTRSGKTIQNKRLLRSGQLFELPRQEVKLLEETYNVKTIVDLRSPNEAAESPNSFVSGAENVLLDVSGKGDFSTSHTAFLQLIESVNAEENLMQSYENFILSENAKEQYRQYFDLLLKQEQGSLLWHCFAGKDRTGVAALYVLSALGVDDTTIMQDYMLTNELREHENQLRIQEMRELKVNEAAIQNMYELLRVKPAYLEYAIGLIDTNFGGRMEFLQNELGIDDRKIALLHDLYLES